MSTTKNPRRGTAIGNAATPQKLELNAFAADTQAWAWDAFKAKAKFLSLKNHFTEDERSAMEAEALIDLLSDVGIVYDPACGKSVEDHLGGVIERRLRRAAAKIADERSIWTESRRSLDVRIGEEENAPLLGDLVSDVATFDRTRIFLPQPRAVAIRNTIKRLRDAKKTSALVRYRAELAMKRTAHPDGDVDVGEMPREACEMCAVGVGGKVSGALKGELTFDISNILARLPDKLREWCWLVMRGNSPVEACKWLGIGRNAYHRKCLPILRRAFAELA